MRMRLHHHDTHLYHFACRGNQSDTRQVRYMYEMHRGRNVTPCRGPRGGTEPHPPLHGDTPPPALASFTGWVGRV